MDAKRQNIYGGYTNPIYDQYYYQYLTVDILETGYFYFFGAIYQDDTTETVYYSKNNGNWIAMPAADRIEVSKNDTIRFKAKLDTSKTIDYNGFYIGNESGSVPFNIYGNIMSIIHGDDFINNSEVNINSSPFREMFFTSQVRDASNLCLPSVNLCEYMYYSFFEDSTLTYAPKIIPANLAENCYVQMFKNCKNLTGQIIIPAPLFCPETGIYDSPYYHMLENVLCQSEESTNTNPPTVEILALMNKQVTITQLVEMLPGDYWQLNSKLKIILPWEGMEGINNDDDYFKAELKYFESENHGKQSGTSYFTKFTESPDVFGHVLDIKNPNMLIANLWGETDSRYNTYDWGSEFFEIIEPLQYFLNIPLTFETIDTCEFIWGIPDYFGNFAGEEEYSGFLEYSINGSQWIKYTKGIIVPPNSTISWRSSIDITNEPTLEGLTFKLNTNGAKLATNITKCKFNAYGNIMSLLSPNFETLDTIPWDECFGYSPESNGTIGIFSGTGINSAENLILPAITLSNSCYAHMFASSSLIIAPRILPVKNVRNLDFCYASMFDYCSQLQTVPIIMLATTFTPPSNGVYTNASNIPSNQRYSTCADLLMNMFANCETLSIAPEIHICYVDTQAALSNGMFRGMFRNTSIKKIKIFSHSPTPGHIYGNYNYGGEFSYFSDNSVEIYCYNEFGNECYDLALSTISTISNNINNLHSMTLPETTPEDNKSKFYIQHNSSTYEFEKTHENMTWNQFIGGEVGSIKFGDTTYYIKSTGAATGANGRFSISIPDIFDTSGPSGYGYPWDYMGRICNSTNERDNVLSSDIIQTNKTYYVNRYFSGSWN